MYGRKLETILFLALLICSGQALMAAGTLNPVDASQSPVQIKDHHVQVVINNGFSKTEVRQVFFNPNEVDLEAIYSFPLPKSASLSEFTIVSGELAINGEVLALEEAEKIYEEERQAGNDAGLAKKEKNRTYSFRVTPVRAQSMTEIRFVYYQPVAIDTGVGRYLYPLEDGGTDEVAKSFWLNNSQVEQQLTFDVILKTSWPVTAVRIPGFESQTQVDRKSEGEIHVHLALDHASLEKDLLFYYRLESDLPGRVEVISYREDDTKPGTFMAIITPGLDLQPIDKGSDYVFVLDISGSMDGKLKTLADGVSRSIAGLGPQDRYRIVLFSDTARNLTHGWVDATPEHVRDTIAEVQNIGVEGGTDLHAGLTAGLSDLDNDRATSMILITDAVANTGELRPEVFSDLMKKYDIRVFGFLLGNSANWPLMKVICDASGGFYAGVSNTDDILGQILLAKSKISYESLHNVELKMGGVHTYDLTLDFASKIYRGQQLVVFGRFSEGGEASLRIQASLTGQDKVYETRFRFPDQDTDHPELERLWALSFIEDLENRRDLGIGSEKENKTAIRDMGVTYQLVTDETAMVVLSDEKFAERGIERKNQQRVARENAAQTQRANRAPTNHRVDTNQPMFQHNAPSLDGGSGGGGAIDPLTALFTLVLTGLSLVLLRTRS